jgi:hypothetical protein
MLGERRFSAREAREVRARLRRVRHATRHELIEVVVERFSKLGMGASTPRIGHMFRLREYVSKRDVFALLRGACLPDSRLRRAFLRAYCARRLSTICANLLHWFVLASGVIGLVSFVAQVIGSGITILP